MSIRYHPRSSRTESKVSFMSFIFKLYNLIYPLAIFGLKLLAPFHSKLSRFVGMRKKILGQYPWLLQNAQDCVLIHAASGEFEYAKPLIRELLKRKVKVVVTYYSPTYQKQIQEFPGVLSCPFPWDRPHIMKEFLGTLQPKLILITRTDLWYNFLKTAQGLSIPTALYSATLDSRSKKVKNFWIRSYYEALLHLVSKIFCVTFDDQKNFQDLFHHTNVETIGDTRFDQVLYRIQNPSITKDHLAFTNDVKLGNILIAGSTWPEDEPKICKAAKQLSQHSIRVAIAPHEPTPQHLQHLEQLLQTLQLPYVYYSKAASWPPGSVLIVDKVGILADLYKWADWAFVGGSFRKQVHSVMEPLAHGCYTFVGPFHINNREAVDFQNINLNIKAHAITPVQSFLKTQELVDAILKTKNKDTLNQIKSGIQDLVKSKSGASQILSDKVLEAISKRN